MPRPPKPRKSMHFALIEAARAHPDLSGEELFRRARQIMKEASHPHPARSTSGREREEHPIADIKKGYKKAKGLYKKIAKEFKQPPARPDVDIDKPRTPPTDMEGVDIQGLSPVTDYHEDLFTPGTGNLFEEMEKAIGEEITDIVGKMGGK